MFAINDDGRIVLIGGNQRESVNFSPNSKSEVIKVKKNFQKLALHIFFWDEY